MANTTGKKYGGRKEGSLNKVTASVKDAIKNTVERYFEAQFFADLDSLTGKDRLAVIAQLIPYIMPKAKDELSEKGVYVSFDEMTEKQKADSEYLKSLSTDELTALSIALEKSEGKNLPPWLGDEKIDGNNDE